MDEQEIMNMMKKIRLLRYQTVMAFMQHLWEQGYVITQMDNCMWQGKTPIRSEIETMVTEWAYK